MHSVHMRHALRQACQHLHCGSEHILPSASAAWQRGEGGLRQPLPPLPHNHAKVCIIGSQRLRCKVRARGEALQGGDGSCCREEQG